MAKLSVTPDLAQRMTATDALFWYAESALPVFRPIIAALYLLDRPPRADWIDAGIDAALALIPRLRQRVVEAPLNLAPPEWTEDPHFDRAYHQRHISVAPPGGTPELLDLAAQLFATPLDRERPLWEAYWIDGLAEGRAAFFMKVHHSLVDGVGSMALLDAMTQHSAEEAPRKVHRRRADLAPTAGWASLSRDAVQRTGDVVGQGISAVAGLVTHPAESWSMALSAVRGLRGVLSDASAPMIDDPLARFTSGLSRRLDTMQVPLSRLVALKSSLHVTINDVVLTALAGCLAAYHRERRVRVPALNCMVPMNLRARHERGDLGNRVGMFNIVLPVGERRVEARLRRIVGQTHRAKRDQRGATYPLLIELLGFVPGAAFRWLARQSLGRVNVACTNVPGVADRRYIAGARIDAIYPFASVVEKTPVVMAMLSYAGVMNIGIDTDPEAIPDPHRISELYEAALGELEQLAGRKSARR